MGDEQQPIRVMSLLEEEAVPVDGGALQWVPVRRRLGIGAFGTNAYRAASAGDAVIEEHVESPGQEELYVVIAGAMRFTAGEREVDVPAGGAVFVADPELRRAATALEDGTVVLAVGGWREKPYHSLPWEPIYLAQEAMRRGDWAEAAETLRREAGEQRESPFIRYRLACCLSRAGDAPAALAELKGAIATLPELRERAASDDDLAAVRALPAWSALEV